jgi:hypothetical protein
VLSDIDSHITDFRIALDVILENLSQFKPVDGVPYGTILQLLINGSALNVFLRSLRSCFDSIKDNDIVPPSFLSPTANPIIIEIDKAESRILGWCRAYLAARNQGLDLIRETRPFPATDPHPRPRYWDNGGDDLVPRLKSDPEVPLRMDAVLRAWRAAWERQSGRAVNKVFDGWEGTRVDVCKAAKRGPVPFPPFEPF